MIGKQSAVKEPVNIWNRTFINVLLTNGMVCLGQQMVQPLTTSYAKTLGTAETVIGLVASAFTTTAILLRVISTPAIDMYNEKCLLYGAMCVMGTAYLGPALTGTVPTISGLRLLQGRGRAFTISCRLALAIDVLPQKKLGQGIGVFALAQSVCQTIDLTLRKFIQSIFGYGTTFLTAAVLMFLGAFCALLIQNHYEKTR